MEKHPRLGQSGPGDPRRDKVAYHEAGHAVIGTLVGMTVDTLTVEPTKDYLGLVTFAPFYDDNAIDLMNTSAVWGVVEGGEGGLLDSLPELSDRIEATRQLCARDAVMLMAGPRAEERFTGKFDQSGAREDLQKIRDFLRVFFCEYGDDEPAAWEAAQAHYGGPTIEEYLDDPLVWWWIMQVAQTAYFGGDMTGDEVRALRPADLT